MVRRRDETTWYIAGAEQFRLVIGGAGRGVVRIPTISGIAGFLVGLQPKRNPLSIDLARVEKSLLGQSPCKSVLGG